MAVGARHARGGWNAERHLKDCADLLGRWGWEALLYRATGGVRFLVATARPG